MTALLQILAVHCCEEENKDTPVLMCHGDCDQVVNYHFGKRSFEELKKTGLNVDFKTYQFMGACLACGRGAGGVERDLRLHCVCTQPVRSRGMGAGRAGRGTCGIVATLFAGHEAVQKELMAMRVN